MRNSEKNKLLPNNKYIYTPPCHHLVDPALDCWLGHLNTAIHKPVYRARRQQQYSRSYDNVIGITKLGLKMLTESVWVAVPNDRDSGFTLESKQAHRQVHKEIPKKSEYQEIATCTKYNIIKEAKGACANIASTIKTNNNLKWKELCQQSVGI